MFLCLDYQLSHTQNIFIAFVSSLFYIKYFKLGGVVFKCCFLMFLSTYSMKHLKK